MSDSNHGEKDKDTDPVDKDKEKTKKKKLSKQEKRLKKSLSTKKSFYLREVEDTSAEDSEISSESESSPPPSSSSSSSSSKESKLSDKVSDIKQENKTESDDDDDIKIIVDDLQRHSIDIRPATSSDDDDDDDIEENKLKLLGSRNRSGSTVVLSRSKSPTPLMSGASFDKQISRKPLLSRSSNKTDEQQPAPSFELMKPTIRKRSTKTIKTTIKEISKITEEMHGYFSIDEETKEAPVIAKVFQKFSDPSSSFIKYPAAVESTPMSPNLKRGTKIGNKISSNFLFPGIPKLVGDIWVFIELFITIFQLIFSLVNMNISSNKTFNIIYICLASINTVLACIDGFLYFYELSTCKTFYKWCRGHQDEEEEEEKEEETKEIEESQEKGKCSRCRVSPKVLNFANKWFELMRTILGELLIYPLVVLDLFDLLGGGSFHPTDKQSRVGFSMFIVGSFYLVLSVYIGRTVMSITTIRSLQGLTSTTNNDSNYTRVVVRFLFHVIGQIFVHLLCVVSVGIKIWQEDSSLNGGSFRASPFLWAVIVGGWLIPFLGVVSYFVVNYYWIQTFSLGLFIDMIGLLEEPDFAQAVFEGGGSLKEEAVEKSEKLLDDVKFYEVKEENEKRNQDINSLAKIVYPLKIPIFILYVLFYDFIIGSFLACLLLEFDKDHNIIVINLATTTGLATMATIVLVVISNFHVICVINLWLLIIVLSLVIILLSSPVLIVIGFVLLYRKYQRKRKDSEREQLLLI